MGKIPDPIQMTLVKLIKKRVWMCNILTLRLMLTSWKPCLNILRACARFRSLWTRITLP